MERIISSHLWSLTFGLLLLGLAGCPSRPPVSEGTAPRPAVMPSYHELALRYNANIQKIDRLWSSANVELDWIDQGKRRWEQGEGNLILILPDHLSLSVGKLGNTLLWVGSDAERFWLFDLQGDKTVYVGRHANVGKPCAQELPLPVRPLDLVRLLGIVPLPVEPAAPTPPLVEWVNGAFLIEPPDQSIRLLLDPVTAMPKRIDLLDARGYSRVIALLSRTEAVQVINTPPGGLPRMNTRIEVTMPERQGRMVLFLSRLTDGREAGKIDERVFDYERLRRLLKPASEVVLDKDCGHE